MDSLFVDATDTSIPQRAFTETGGQETVTPTRMSYRTCAVTSAMGRHPWSATSGSARGAPADHRPTRTNERPLLNALEFDSPHVRGHGGGRVFRE